MYKTTTRKIHSLQYGTLIIRRTFYCPSLNHTNDKTTVDSKKQFSHELKGLISGKKQFSFDVMCLVGKLRFVHDHSREEIQEILKYSYNLSISTGSISNYSIEFLIRFYFYHRENFELLVQAMTKDGGYVLGADGSGQEGSKRILLLMDLLKGWTLITKAISSEKSDLIIPVFDELVETAGTPLAYVRDMGRGLRKAGETVFPSLPTRECNFHFLRDVGKDIMLADYQEFKKVMVNCKIKPKLDRFRKNLKKIAEEQKINMKDIIQSLKLKTSLESIPLEHILLSELYHLLSWILNYSEDALGLRFPYSLPWVLLYHRCRSAQEIYTEIKQSSMKLTQKPPYFEEFDLIISTLLSDNIASKIIILEKSLMKSYNYFLELRKILRLSEIKGDIPRDQLILSNNEIKKVEDELIKFKTKLLNDTKNPKNLNSDTENIIIKHLIHHWKYLVVPNIELTIDGENKSLAIPRAISLADSRFGKIKTSIRKRTGRTQINYDLDRYGTFLCYLENLHSSEYVEVMFGTIKNLPQALSTIPSYKVKSFIKEFNASQQCDDITKARGDKEYENLLGIVSSANNELNLSPLIN